MSQSHTAVGYSTVWSGLFLPATLSHSWPCHTLPCSSAPSCVHVHKTQGSACSRKAGCKLCDPEAYFPFTSKPQLFLVLNKHTVLKRTRIRLWKRTVLPQNSPAFQNTLGKTAQAPQHVGFQSTQENKCSGLTNGSAKPLPKETAPSPLFKLQALTLPVCLITPRLLLLFPHTQKTHCFYLLPVPEIGISDLLSKIKLLSLCGKNMNNPQSSSYAKKSIHSVTNTLSFWAHSSLNTSH